MMIIVIKNWIWILVVEVVLKGKDNFLICIVFLKKEKGILIFCVVCDIWNYLFKVDCVIKLLLFMMSVFWMGSYVMNNDLVCESWFVDDFDCLIVFDG